jgi:hypothetical protein
MASAPVMLPALSTGSATRPDTACPHAQTRRVLRWRPRLEDSAPPRESLIHPFNYIGKLPALPGDAKSLTAPYFETLRNADKSAATDLFGEGRRAKADEALPREFSAAALWQTPGFSCSSSLCRTALATVPPRKTVQRGALAPAGIGSASSAFARVGQRSRPA